MAIAVNVCIGNVQRRVPTQQISLRDEMGLWNEELNVVPLISATRHLERVHRDGIIFFIG